MTNEEKLKIHVDNLDALSKRQKIIKQQKEVTIKDVTDVFGRDLDGLKELYEFFSNEHVKLSPQDKIYFCRKICD